MEMCRGKPSKRHQGLLHRSGGGSERDGNNEGGFGKARCVLQKMCSMYLYVHTIYYTTDPVT